MARLSPEALATLQPLLVALRTVADLTETSPAIFYFRRIPMLHFHNTAQGLVADLKCVVPTLSGFDRMNISTEAAQKKLVKEAASRCAILAAARPAKRV